MAAPTKAGPQAQLRKRQQSLEREKANSAKLEKQLTDALARQVATAGILKTIAASPADIQPVLDALAERAARLTDSPNVTVLLREGDALRAQANFSHDAGKLPDHGHMVPIRKTFVSGRAVLRRRTVHVEDMVPLLKTEYPDARDNQRQFGFRTVLAVPMIREGHAIGVIYAWRREVRLFTAEQVALLKTFADQAVIAIENARLFNETKEALERQTATGEILASISGSMTDTKPVFDAIVRNLLRLFGTRFAMVALLRDGMIEMPAVDGEPGFERVIERYPRPLDDSTIVGQVMLSKQARQLTPVLGNPDTPPGTEKFARDFGFNSVIFAPMIREDKVIGAIGTAHREPKEFDDKQVSLIRAFADQAVIAIENVRLFNETTEALERQTATAEILKVISSSPTDTQPVFDAILQSATRLCDADTGILFRYESGVYQAIATRIPDPEFAALFKKPRRPGPKSGLGRLMSEKRPVHIPDVLDDDAYREGDPLRLETIKLGGVRTWLGAPMLKDGQLAGAIVIYRKEQRAFGDQQISLLQTFAEQAVIAIENVRLFKELEARNRDVTDALEQQTATAEILRVISSSPTNVQPVFDAIATSALQLFGGLYVAVVLVRGEQIDIASAGGQPEVVAKVKNAFPIPLDRESVTGRTIVDRAIQNLPNMEAPELPEFARSLSHSVGVRALLGAPMLREGTAIGAIMLFRENPGEFSAKQESLLQTFADQAVIAIENVRLFNETKEALERQTATAEILKVISSSPTDVQPVFDTIVRNATRLCESAYANVFRFDGELLHYVTSHGWPPHLLQNLLNYYPARPDRLRVAGRVILEKQTVRVEDTLSDTEYDPDMARAMEYRRILGIPLLREDSVIGTITVGWTEPGAIQRKHEELLRTFADQAVIAIENVRLFNETKEALERQTATAEILKVISSSPTDVRPVFDAIAENGVRLCGAGFGNVFRFDGELISLVAHHNVSQQELEGLHRIWPMRPHPESIVGRAVLERRVIHVLDYQAEFPKYASLLPSIRSIVQVPMLRGDIPIGVLSIYRREIAPFTQHQIDLLQTFAAQAVIAIENVRLFKELEARTEALTRSVGQLTALGEVGQAISSTLELETVLQTIVSRAVQLAGLDGGSIYEYDERTEEFRLQAGENMEEELVEAVRRTPVRKGEGAIGRSAVTREPSQVPDILDDSYQSGRKEILVRAGYRAILAVPLLREDHLLGALQVFRRTPGPFAPEIVELLKTFATQSAMAIQNARLFREIAEKGKQLEVASRHKSDFLSSMSHELRTPLNAILGFNEMILGDVYGSVPADMQPPLAQMQTSGKHLLRLINNVLDLAKIEAGRMELSLQDYSVHDTVESVRSTLRPLAADKGLEFLATVPADIPLAYGDPGRIAQCLMNLAGNSVKFTKAGKVEISVAEKDGLLTYRVIDTGIGIAPDKIASLFTEFKQTDATIASEYGGTGLGLSISRKFIEMHGGRIWVESELGKGSAFIFEVPLRAKTT